MSLGCCARFYVRLCARLAAYSWTRYGVPARRAARLALTRSRRAVANPEYWRVVRGAFLAPWFAVSLGIVVAASLSLATPRAALSFPPAEGGSNAPHKPARNTSSGPTAAVNRQAQVHRPVDPDDWSGRQVLVRYRLMTERRGQFMAMIAISSRRPLGNWRLRFVLPGASVKSIMWGQWARDDSGAVVVYGDPVPWPRSAPDQARIVIEGTGAPQWPERCAYNGTHCAFGQLEP